MAKRWLNFFFSFLHRTLQMMSSGTEYRNRPICDNLQTRNRSPNYTTDNSQSWWWHGGGHGGATTTTTTTMSKEDESNWAWPKGLVSSGPKTSIKQMQTTLSPPQGKVKYIIWSSYKISFSFVFLYLKSLVFFYFDDINFLVESY